MVDAEALDLALADQAHQQPVGFLEDRGLFHAHRGELGDVEKAAVIDLLRRNPPERQAIRLRVEQRVESVETRRIVRPAIDRLKYPAEQCAKRRRSGMQRVDGTL